MFKNKTKIRNSPEVGKSGNSLLRLFRSDNASNLSLSPLGFEETHQEDTYDYTQKEISNAMLIAEQNKAKAIMALQKYRGC